MKKMIMIAVSAIVFAGCSVIPAQQAKSGNTSIPIPSTSSSISSSSSPITAARTVSITGANFSYDVKEIRVKKGESVAVKFISSEGMHDFVIDELNVRTSRIAEGQTETVLIPTDKIGTFSFYCSVGNHRAMGMEGKLIIE